ncbi:MAG TPA: histone H1 [Blastocatellia bacterium]
MARYKDPVEVAKDVFDQFLSIADPDSVQPKSDELKDQKKAEAGHKGGLKGGPARAKALTPRRRRSIAKKASQTRWKKS